MRTIRPGSFIPRATQGAILVSAACLASACSDDPSAARRPGAREASPLRPFSAAKVELTQQLIPQPALPVIRMLPVATAPDSGFIMRATITPTRAGLVRYWFQVTTDPRGCDAMANAMPANPDTIGVSDTTPVEVAATTTLAPSSAVRYRLSVEGAVTVRSGCADPTVSPETWPPDPTIITTRIVESNLIDTIIIGMEVNPHGVTPVLWRPLAFLNVGPNCSQHFRLGVMGTSAADTIVNGGSDPTVATHALAGDVGLGPATGSVTYQVAAQWPGGPMVRGPCAIIRLPALEFELSPHTSVFMGTRGDPVPAEDTLVMRLSPVRQLRGSFFSMVRAHTEYSSGASGWLNVTLVPVPLSGTVEERRFVVRVTTTDLPIGSHTASVFVNGFYGERPMFETAPIKVVYNVTER